MKRATLTRLFILLPTWAVWAAPARAAGGPDVVGLRCEIAPAPSG
jgi:hypothetical protein